MSYTENGIAEIKKGNFENAFNILRKGFFEEGELEAACYLAQMYYDERITERTPESLASAMLLWCLTSNETPSSAHKLGVNLFSFSEKAKSAGLKYIKSAAERNYPISFCVLGVLSFHDKNYNSAVNYFSKYEGIKKDKKALLMYADSLCKMDNPDIETAEKVYAVCAEEYKDSAAYRKLSELYLVPQYLNKKKSFEFIRKAAELGDALAAENVGIAYYLGNEYIKDNLSRDYEKAYKFLTLASQHNLGNATACLGDMYANGNYVQANENKAVKLYDLAIQMGYNGAYNNKGMFYYLRNDYKNSYECLRKRYDSGDKNFTAVLFECTYKLYSDVKEKKSELIKYALDCKMSGYNLSEPMHLVLGRAFYEGEFLNKDIDMAINHMQNCINDPEACYIVGKMAAYGEISSISPSESEPYLLKSANAGISDAMLTLGKLYKKWNLATKAINMLMKAYSKGEKEAAQIISDMYLNGDVTGRKDKKKAAEWSAKAN